MGPDSAVACRSLPYDPGGCGGVALVQAAYAGPVAGTRARRQTPAGSLALLRCAAVSKLRHIALLSLAWPCLVAAQACPPADTPREALRALAAAGWQLDDAARREALALALAPCLASPDPELRDTLALSALTAWLRGGGLSADTVRRLGNWARGGLSSFDGDGFGPPFAALLLAEVARVDRLQPLWTPAERQEMLAAAVDFLVRVRDYRGFEPRDGWRHGVAHGADLLVQLALNPQVDRAGLDRLLEAVLAQATPSTHFYVFGEGERLARVLVFVARRAQHSAADWGTLLGRIALAGAPEPGAPATLEALARRHNAKALLLPLYAALQEGNDAEMRQRLAPGLSAALRTLW